MHEVAVSVHDHAEAREGLGPLDRAVHDSLSSEHRRLISYDYGLLDRFQMDTPAALHRIKVGVPATVEHSSEAGPETGKWIAETTQVCLLGRTCNEASPMLSFVELHHFHGCLKAASTC